MTFHTTSGRPPKRAEAHQKACGGTYRDGEGDWRVCTLIERHLGGHDGPTIQEFEESQRAPDAARG